MGFVLHSRSPFSFPFRCCVVSSKAPLVPGHNHTHQSRDYCDLLCSSRPRHPSLHPSSAPVHTMPSLLLFPTLSHWNWCPSAFSVYIKTSRTLPRHVCCALALFFCQRFRAHPPPRPSSCCVSLYFYDAPIHSCPLIGICTSHRACFTFISTVFREPPAYFSYSRFLIFICRNCAHYSYSFPPCLSSLSIPLSRTPQSCSITSKAHFPIPQVQ